MKITKFSKISFDSRDVQPNTLFFCKGSQFKPEYLDKAIENGATAYVSETDYNKSIPCIQVDDIRVAMADMANEFYNKAWSNYPCIGITGSKGKSTTLYMLKSIFEAANKKLAYLSSIDTYDGIEEFESHLTTPEALDLHKHFANARDSKMDAFAMEVSSQGLKYNRTRGVIYSIGVFLNFGADHIGCDEHPDVEDYFNSKLKLMSQCKVAIINKESDRFEQIYEAAKNSKVCEKVICFSAKELTYPLSIPGKFNEENGMAALLIARELGIDEEAIKEGLLNAKVPGRMEVFENKEKDVICIVDYAHNKLSFEKLFSSLKEMYPGYRIEALFGSAGGKAFQRRYDLAEVVSKYADYVWVTDEDPWLEDPMKICKEIKENLDKFNTPSQIIVDRTEAIKTAISGAKRKTVIVLTGKGREEYIHTGNEYLPFTPEPEQVTRLLNEL